jgi:hypothetical protein
MSERTTRELRGSTRLWPDELEHQHMQRLPHVIHAPISDARSRSTRKQLAERSRDGAGQTPDSRGSEELAMADEDSALPSAMKNGARAGDGKAELETKRRRAGAPQGQSRGQAGRRR